MSSGAFEVELELDRVEAQLARELPAHMRAFAAAHADGTRSPAAPELASRASTIGLARRALALPTLAARGLALVRLAAPLAIERESAVVVARAAPATWDALADLAHARDAAARARFGRSAIEVMHALHGAREPEGAVVVPPASPAWTAPDLALDARAIEDAWRELARRYGVSGRVTIVRAEARPRAFVVEPGRAVRGGMRTSQPGEVIVVVPARIETPAARFAVLHELGHAVANLCSPAGLSRVVDEAVASYVARLLEDSSTRWYSPFAAAARARRTLLAHALDQLERDLAARGRHAAREAPGVTFGARPPWALWHDPAAQAIYVAAEDVADRLAAALGPSPAPGALAELLAAERARVDRGLVI